MEMSLELIDPIAHMAKKNMDPTGAQPWKSPRDFLLINSIAIVS